MPNPLEINIEQKDTHIIVHMTGDATVTDVDVMRQHLTPLQETDAVSIKKIVLNLAELVYINSLGLGVLLELRQQLLEQEIDICMAAVSKKVHQVFQKMNLLELFPEFETAEQAASS